MTYVSEAPTVAPLRSYEVKTASMLSLMDVMADVISEWGDIDVSIHAPEGLASCDEVRIMNVVIFTDADFPYAVIYTHYENR